MSMKAAKKGIGVCAALLFICLPGCVVGPKYHAPAPPPPTEVYKESPTQFSGDQAWKVGQPSDAMLRGKWWEIFNEPELNALEDQLAINNQNIKQFFENYMAARAIVREARSQFYPTISVGPAFTRSSNSGSNSANGATTSNQGSSYSLPIDASWTPDLWGKIRNTVRQAQGAAQVSAAELENERLTEQASLAQYYFEIRGQDMLQKIYNETVEADKKTVELTQTRYDVGIDNQISVEQAKTALESAVAGATNVGVARAQYEHAIAMLVGKPASSFSIPVKPMTAAPPAIPIGVPSELLERRPDIAAAERTMAQANATIGIAYAAYYPALTLSAGGGLQNSSFSGLFTGPNRFWSVGASISETLFDAGLRRATVQQYIATYNADVAAYRQTVLTAFQQTEDALAEVRILSNEVKQEEEAVKSAQTLLQLEQYRYQTGIDPYLNVLVSQTTLLSNQQSLNNLQVQVMTSAVALVEALGGGWDRSQLPSASQVTQKPDKTETKIEQ